MTLVNLNQLRDVTVINDPFPHFVVSEFVDPESMDQVLGDYPRITKGGSFPQNSVQGGPAFNELCALLRDTEIRDIFAEKFGVPLDDRPTTLTVRGKCRLKDGKIHTDSKSKLITVLLYLNEPWERVSSNLSKKWRPILERSLHSLMDPMPGMATLPTKAYDALYN